MVNVQAAEDKPILVFDSGIGGLTVLREARVLIPERRFLYVADDAAFPYGDWEQGALQAHIVQLFGQLLRQYDPALCIVACNTAFTLSGAALRAAYPEMCFVGTVPAIKPAAERTYSGLVSVLATPGTVQRDYTRDLIQSFASQCKVQLVGSSRLARMAESYIRGQALPDKAVRAEIADCFIETSGARTDIIVLACTHYPFMVNVFRRLAPWPVDWLDPAEAIARRARSLLPRYDQLLHLPEDDLVWFTSGQPDFATHRLMSSFGLQLAPGSTTGGGADHRGKSPIGVRPPRGLSLEP